MSTPTIRRVSHSEILGAVNAPQLIAEYAAECSIAEAAPQNKLYEAMEEAGSLQCFGAYVGADLVGFASVVSVVMPHNGKRLATIESIFVTPSERSSGAGNALLSTAEQYADETDCVAITATARVGSALDKVLSRRHECQRTHTVYTRWL